MNNFENEMKVRISGNKISPPTEIIPLNMANENICLNIEDKNSKEAENVTKKVWELLKESKLLVIFAAFFAACSGAVWSAYGILLATSIEALGQVKLVEQKGKEMAGWFILLAAISGICIALQK